MVHGYGRHTQMVDTAETADLVDKIPRGNCYANISTGRVVRGIGTALQTSQV